MLKKEVKVSILPSLSIVSVGLLWDVDVLVLLHGTFHRKSWYWIKVQPTKYNKKIVIDTFLINRIEKLSKLHHFCLTVQEWHEDFHEAFG